MSDTHLAALAKKAPEYIKFESKNKHTWCSGCGNFGILNALTRALTLQNIKPHNVLMCFDVGCNGNASDKLQAYTIHGLHGRVTALATGAALANHKLPIIASAGDGATFSEGINHLIHAIRNNVNITFICHNNNNYGLTTGQSSSTTPVGQKMNGTAGEVFVEPLNSLQMILSLNPAFVARGFAGDVEHLSQLIQQGISHQGFSYIEVFQACPTYNKSTPQSWYFPRIEKQKSNQNTDIWTARQAVEDTSNRLATGVIYHNPNAVDYYTQYTKINRPNYATALCEEVFHHDVSGLMQSFV